MQTSQVTCNFPQLVPGRSIGRSVPSDTSIIRGSASRAKLLESGWAPWGNFPHSPNELDSVPGKILVSGTTDVFDEALKLREVTGDEKRKKILALSQRYRAVIESALANNPSPSEDEDKLRAYERLKNAKIIWHLSEVLLLDTNRSDSGYFFKNLLDWVDENFPYGAAAETRVPEGEKGIDEVDLKANAEAFHATYEECRPSDWAAVLTSVLHLQFRKAIELLRLHQSSDELAYSSVALYLETAEILLKQAYSHLSFEEYHQRRNSLAKECATALDVGLFREYPQLNVIVQLLASRRTVLTPFIREFPRQCHWSELLPGMMFFMNEDRPNIKSIAQTAEMCIDLTLVGDEVLPAVDVVVLHMCRGEITEMLRVAQEGLDCKWFFAHWTDLLYHAGVLDSLNSVEKHRFRNYQLQEYATLFLETRSNRRNVSWLLDAALPYFDELARSDNPENRFREFLQRVEIADDDLAWHIRSIALDRGYSEIVSSVCSTKAWEFLRSDRYVSAIYWAMHSEDGAVIRKVIPAALNRIVGRPDLLSEIVLMLNIPTSWVERNSDLASLDSYKAVCILKAAGKYREMTDALRAILEKQVLPEKFREHLVSEYRMYREDFRDE